MKNPKIKQVNLTNLNGLFLVVDLLARHGKNLFFERVLKVKSFLQECFQINLVEFN